MCGFLLVFFGGVGGGGVLLLFEFLLLFLFLFYVCFPFRFFSFFLFLSLFGVVVGGWSTGGRGVSLENARLWKTVLKNKLLDDSGRCR